MSFSVSPTQPKDIEENSTALAEESLKELIMKVRSPQQIINQFELYELDQQHLNKFETEISKAVTFLDVIEVIKQMIDVLMAHINSLTKYSPLTRDLYECSHYDSSKNDQNMKETIANLQKEVKVNIRVCSEQAKIIEDLQQQLAAKDEDLKSCHQIIHVLVSHEESYGPERRAEPESPPVPQEVNVAALAVSRRQRSQAQQREAAAPARPAFF